MGNKPHTHRMYDAVPVSSHHTSTALASVETAEWRSAPDYIVVSHIHRENSINLKSEETGHHVRKIWVIATLITSLWQVEKTAIFYVFTIFVASYILLCRIFLLYIKSSNHRCSMGVSPRTMQAEPFLSVFLPFQMNFNKEIACVRRPLCHYISRVPEEVLVLFAFFLAYHHPPPP